MHPEIEDVNATVTLIQALIPLDLRAAGEALVAEVTRLTGPKWPTLRSNSCTRRSLPARST